MPITYGTRPRSSVAASSPLRNVDSISAEVMMREGMTTGGKLGS